MTTPEAPTTPTLKKLTPNLMVEDVDRTVDFYQRVLGFETRATVPETGALNWAMLARDGVTLMFQSRASLSEEIPALAATPIGGSLTFYTEVAGVQALYEQLRGTVEVVQDLHETFYGTLEFSFRDINGYIVCFSEAKDEA